MFHDLLTDVPQEFGSSSEPGEFLGPPGNRLFGSKFRLSKMGEDAYSNGKGNFTVEGITVIGFHRV